MSTAPADMSRNTTPMTVRVVSVAFDCANGARFTPTEDRSLSLRKG